MTKEPCRVIFISIKFIAAIKTILAIPQDRFNENMFQLKIIVTAITYV